MKIDPSKVNLTEADIEEYLWQNPSHLAVDAHRVRRWIARQYEVPSGRIDLLGQLESGYIVVVEVKNVAIDGRAIAQVCRYAFDINNILVVRHGGHEQKVFKVVVGPSLSDQAFRECEACDTYYIQFSVALDLDLNGMSWGREFYHQRNETYDALSRSELWEEPERYREFYWAEWEKENAERRAKLAVADDFPPDEYTDVILEGDNDGTRTDDQHDD